MPIERKVAASSTCSLWLGESDSSMPNTCPSCNGTMNAGPLGAGARGTMKAIAFVRCGSSTRCEERRGAQDAAKMPKLWNIALRFSAYDAHG